MFGVPLQVLPPSLLRHTDVSLFGWGAHLLDLMVLGGVVQGRGLSAHLCAGNDGGFSSYSYASATVVGSKCRPAEQQCHGFHFSLASGWNGVLCPVLRGCRGSSLNRLPFSLPDDQVYSREEQCFDGPAQSSRPYSSHGMVPFSEGVQGDL